jgi:hypothetical protein
MNGTTTENFGDVFDRVFDTSNLVMKISDFIKNMRSSQKNVLRALAEMPKEIEIEAFEEVVGFLGDWDCDCGCDFKACQGLETCPISNDDTQISYYLESFQVFRSNIFFKGPAYYRTVAEGCCFRLKEIIETFSVEKVKIHIDFEDCNKCITVWGQGMYRSPDPVVEKEIARYGYV